MIFGGDRSRLYSSYLGKSLSDQPFNLPKTISFGFALGSLLNVVSCFKMLLNYFKFQVIHFFPVNRPTILVIMIHRIKSLAMSVTEMLIFLFYGY